MPPNFALQRHCVAQVNVEARASGISCTAVTFTLIDGAFTSILGGGGIRAANPNTDTPPSYTVAADITLGVDQTWGVINNGAGLTTLLVSGPVQDGDIPLVSPRPVTDT